MVNGKQIAIHHPKTNAKETSISQFPNPEIPKLNAKISFSEKTVVLSPIHFFHLKKTL